MPLTGGSVSASFQTAFYTAGVADQFTVSVYDTQGNLQNQSVTLKPNVG